LIHFGVAQLAQKHNIPVVALAGGVTEKTSNLNGLGITAYFSIVNGPMSLETAMDSKTTYTNLQVTSKQLFRLIRGVRWVIYSNKLE
jgi:glycerate 2-kinase